MDGRKEGSSNREAITQEPMMTAATALGLGQLLFTMTMVTVVCIVVFLLL